MNLKLPKIVEQFLKSSNVKHFEKYSDCFTKNATIDDIGQIVRDIAFIKNPDNHNDFEYQLEPIAVIETKDQIFLKVNVAGAFEGSPLHFVLRMYLNSGLIEKLKIEIVE